MGTVHKGKVRILWDSNIAQGGRGRDKRAVILIAKQPVPRKDSARKSRDYNCNPSRITIVIHWITLITTITLMDYNNYNNYNYGLH